MFNKEIVLIGLLSGGLYRNSTGKSQKFVAAYVKEIFTVSSVGMSYGRKILSIKLQRTEGWEEKTTLILYVTSLGGKYGKIDRNGKASKSYGKGKNDKIIKFENETDKYEKTND